MVVHSHTGAISCTYPSHDLVTNTSLHGSHEWLGELFVVGENGDLSNVGLLIHSGTRIQSQATAGDMKYESPKDFVLVIMVKNRDYCTWGFHQRGLDRVLQHWPGYRELRNKYWPTLATLNHKLYGTQRGTPDDGEVIVGTIMVV